WGCSRVSPPPSPSEATRLPYTLHGLVSEAARVSPDHAAVRCSGREMSYRELDQASNGLARALRAGGVRPGDRVGILLPKSLEMVGAVYGIMKAGGAYVPLDPQAPVSRAALVASHCSVAPVVTTPARAAWLLEEVAGAGRKPAMALLADDGRGR